MQCFPRASTSCLAWPHPSGPSISWSLGISVFTAHQGCFFVHVSVETHLSSGSWWKRSFLRKLFFPDSPLWKQNMKSLHQTSPVAACPFSQPGLCLEGSDVCAGFCVFLGASSSVKNTVIILFLWYNRAAEELGRSQLLGASHVTLVNVLSSSCVI